MQMLKMPYGKCSAGLLAGVGMFIAGSGVASAAFTLTPGTTQTPVGNSAGFIVDYNAGHEAFQTTYTSPQQYVSQDLGSGQTYDLRFTIQSTVYKNTINGTEDFVYQLDNISDNNGTTTFGDTVTRLSLQSFAGYGVNADYEFNTGQIFGNPADVPPVTIDRSATSGAIVGFNFPTDSSTTNAMTPGTYSDYLVVRTDASGFVFGTASVIGGLAHSTRTDAASGQILMVPEPASLALAITAGALTLGRRRRSVC